MSFLVDYLEALTCCVYRRPWESYYIFAKFANYFDTVKCISFSTMDAQYCMSPLFDLKNFLRGCMDFINHYRESLEALIHDVNEEWIGRCDTVACDLRPYTLIVINSVTASFANAKDNFWFVNGKMLTFRAKVRVSAPLLFFARCWNSERSICLRRSMNI
jgi:hypothetical protein